MQVFIETLLFLLCLTCLVHVRKFSDLEAFCVLNAGDDHSLDLNLKMSTPSSGDGPKDNERLGHLQFHPYAHEARRPNVIVGYFLFSPPLLAICTYVP